MQIIPVIDPQMNQNTYVLVESEDCLIIDPGNDGDDILQKIHSLIAGKRLRGVIYTHCHFDHIRGGRYFSCDQYMSKEDIAEMPRQTARARSFWGVDFKEPENLKELSENMVLGSFIFQVLKTPGHTPGSVCFLFYTKKHRFSKPPSEDLSFNELIDVKNDVLFTGDTLFKGTYGRTDIGGNDAQMRASLKFLATLPDDLVIYPGHAVTSTIGAEKTWINGD